MLVYSEDLLVEHLAGAISSVGTEWQKGNRMERKKTKHVNNAEIKKTKENKNNNNRGFDNISYEVARERVNLKTHGAGKSKSEGRRWWMERRWPSACEG